MTKGIMTFYPVEKKHHDLIYGWLHKIHVQPYFYGEGLKNTLKNLEFFVNGIKTNGSYRFEHWIAYIDEIPFGFLMTSRIDGPYNSNDPYSKWYEDGKETITLDLLIGEEDYLGKGLASRMIQEFLLDKFSHISKVMIDPEEDNPRAIRVYEKAGFRKIEKFAQTHDDPKPCWMMHMEIEELKRLFNKP